MKLPVYIDRTRGISLNPMIEYIKSAMALYRQDFSYEAVFHYLRSGLSDLSLEEVDLLENYCIQTGIRGYKSYSRLFVRKTPDMEGQEEKLEQLNAIRENFLSQISMLSMEKKGLVKDYINHLYDFLVANRVQEKLLSFEKQFEKEKNASKQREYAQIYRLVMELLEQVIELLGEEEITLEEFADILEAGFGEDRGGNNSAECGQAAGGGYGKNQIKAGKGAFLSGGK